LMQDLRAEMESNIKVGHKKRDASWHPFFL